MKIGVSGASGKLGQSVLEELKKRGGHDIVAISRTPSATGSGVEGRFGDYDRPEELAKAYQGLDRLLLIPGIDLTPGARSRQHRAAVEAAVAAGVGHIFFLSAAGTRKAEDPALEASYWVGEQTLIAKAPAWTILRMNYYAESLADEIRAAGTSGVIAGLAENKVAFVSRDDIAAASAGALVGDGHDGAIYNLTGSKAVTGAERALIASELTGHPVSFLPLPEEALRGGLEGAGLPSHVADVVIGIQRVFAAGGNNVVTGDVEKLAGRPPRDLREALATALGE